MVHERVTFNKSLSRYTLKFFLVLCLVLAIQYNSVSAAVPTRLAALDLADPGALLNEADARLLSDTIRITSRSVLPAEQYIIMTKDNIFQLLPPDINVADCGGDCAIEAGRNLGARHLLTGEVASVGGMYRISISLYDTESANLLGVTQASGKEIFDLEASLVQETTRLLMALPGAAPDQLGLNDEVLRRRQGMVNKRNLTNRILTIGSGLAAGTAVYFHISANSAYDDHVLATDSETAASTWEDYESSAGNRNIATGVAGGLILWRLLRVLSDGPSTEEIKKNLIEERRLEQAVRLGHSSDMVVWAFRVGF